MTDSAGPTGVGRTALGMAMIRAQESRRDDRLFDDPLAAAFLSAAPTSFDPAERAADRGGRAADSWGSAIGTHAVVRTRFYDDQLMAAADGGVRQGVLLAAGLDTRAYRLQWPAGMHLYEIDLPDVLAFKERVLAEQAATARCRRQPVAADLDQDWVPELSEAGFARDMPTVWIAEGLFVYLGADVVETLLDTVTELSVVGSRLAFEASASGPESGGDLLLQAEAMPRMSEYTAMWKGGFPEAPTWLDGRGWRTRVHALDRVASSYGRATTSAVVGGFVTAVLH